MIVQGAGVVVTFAGVVAGLAVQVQDGAFVHFGSTTSPASVDLTGVGASAEVDGANSAVQFGA